MSPGVSLIFFVLLVFPGILGSGYIALSTHQPDKSAYDKAVGAVIFAVLSYGFLGILEVFLPLLGFYPAGLAPVLNLHMDKDLLPLADGDFLFSVTEASVVSICLAILWSKVVQWDLLHLTLRCCRLTDSTGYGSNWDETLFTLARNNWINIVFADGNEYIGWLKSFSSGSKERSIVLNNVRKYNQVNQKWDKWPKDHRIWIPDSNNLRSIRIYLDEIPKRTHQTNQSKGDKNVGEKQARKRQQAAEQREQTATE